MGTIDTLKTLDDLVQLDAVVRELRQSTYLWTGEYALRGWGTVKGLDDIVSAAIELGVVEQAAQDSKPNLRGRMVRAVWPIPLAATKVVELDELYPGAVVVSDLGHRVGHVVRVDGRTVVYGSTVKYPWQLEYAPGSTVRIVA